MPAPEPQTIVGKSAVIEGKLTLEGTLRVDGHVRGQIHTRGTVVVSAGARVEAEIAASMVVIYGEVVGNVVATGHVELHPPARVRGNLDTPSLSIDRGVVFEGGCTMQKRAAEQQGKPADALKVANG